MNEKEKKLAEKFIEFYRVVSTLRDPEDGCPWDIKQDHKSIRENFIEETYEAIEAIDTDDMASLKEELGDVMLHVLFHADIEERAGEFDIGDVFDGISKKLIRRHPHVFGDENIDNPEEVLQSWEQIKKEEKAERREQTGDDVSLLDGVPMSMPALIVAQRIQERASRIGFDWGEKAPVWDKVYEELDELKHEDNTPEEIEDELGDVLFAITNLARFMNVNSEMALRSTIKKFYRRFRHVEARIIEEGLENPSLDVMDGFWDEAKKAERDDE
ncbi:MAG: nucleoside triphosphate pyrophosphohydrolase [Candidatus Zixiibacteriota bacterium]